MRKNVNKLVAFAIGISVISGSVIPAFAAESTQNNTNVIYVQGQMKPVLTLDNAIKAAVSNSAKLALKSKEIKLYEDKLDIQEEIDDFQDDDNDFPYDHLELLLKQKEEQKDYLKDQIAQDITNKYNDLVAKGKELDNLKKQIEIKTKELKDSELKKKLGLITSIEMKSAEIEIETLKNNQKTKEAQLKNSQDYFKVLTNADLTQYTLEQDPKFEIFRIDGSVDAYLDKVIDKYLKYDEKILELNKDNLKDNKADKPGDAPDKDDSKFQDVDEEGNESFNEGKYEAAEKEYLGEWATYGQYLESKYGVSSGIVTLDENKKSLKNGLKESYTALLDLENNINVMKSTIEVNNKQLSVAKLQYDMGLITKTQYDKQVLASEDLQTNLRTLIDNYNKLKNNIQKPWLLNS